ncbi:tetratricopeptide repeat protein [Aggregicoccus sp. 17bor-14]|uniref:tetratricopeptide repeat protein n=1 Tax=Myxococcaceae TaxID=31 RepID=UPI00129D15B0|nr:MULTISPECIES: tetratricopeptide repeat protein [Myxococcaceae]MBF5042444.1 tetratricopeptide repeat protein [Simulacricoccus sp. 17bor-14]MRI88215.1 tetratricopeptide repeat protein [Aggregicoccus sp. 17bor-14]
MNLEAVRRKVEAGERLSPAELALLEAAAAREGGPTLRLALAHARIDAGAELEALRLLEALVRDFPRELQVHLGHARALLALERYREGEAALQRALALAPEDPEALKVLAVLALRRGERARAAELVARVLRADPLDEEARLLEAELAGTPGESCEAGGTTESVVARGESVRSGTRAPSEAAAGRDMSAASRASFVDALIGALRGQGALHRVEGEQLWVQPRQGPLSRVDLASLHAGFVASGEALEGHVSALAARLREGGGEASADELLAQVLPVLRPDGFVTRAFGSLHREGPAGLRVFYVLQDPELVRYVPREAWGLAPETVDAAAWRNLEARPAALRPVQRDEQGGVALASETTGLWAVAAGDGSDAARLLTHELQARLALQVGEDALWAFLGWRELAVLSRTREGLDGLQGSGDGIAGRFVLERGGLRRGA